MAKDLLKHNITTLKRGLDEFINNYEDCPYAGCGYNFGAEARRRAQDEKILEALDRREQECA